MVKADRLKWRGVWLIWLVVIAEADRVRLATRDSSPLIPLKHPNSSSHSRSNHSPSRVKQPSLPASNLTLVDTGLETGKLKTSEICKLFVDYFDELKPEKRGKQPDGPPFERPKIWSVYETADDRTREMDDAVCLGKKNDAYVIADAKDREKCSKLAGSFWVWYDFDKSARKPMDTGCEKTKTLWQALKIAKVYGGSEAVFPLLYEELDIEPPTWAEDAPEKMAAKICQLPPEDRQPIIDDYHKYRDEMEELITKALPTRLREYKQLAKSLTAFSGQNADRALQIAGIGVNSATIGMIIVTAIGVAGVAVGTAGLGLLGLAFAGIVITAANVLVRYKGDKEVNGEILKYVDQTLELCNTMIATFNKNKELTLGEKWANFKGLSWKEMVKKVFGIKKDAANAKAAADVELLNSLDDAVRSLGKFDPKAEATSVDGGKLIACTQWLSDFIKVMLSFQTFLNQQEIDAGVKFRQFLVNLGVNYNHKGAFDHALLFGGIVTSIAAGALQASAGVGLMTGISNLVALHSVPIAGIDNAVHLGEGAALSSFFDLYWAVTCALEVRNEKKALDTIEEMTIFNKLRQEKEANDRRQTIATRIMQDSVVIKEEDHDLLEPASMGLPRPSFSVFASSVAECRRKDEPKIPDTPNDPIATDVMKAMGWADREIVNEAEDYEAQVQSVLKLKPEKRKAFEEQLEKELYHYYFGDIQEESLKHQESTSI